MELPSNPEDRKKIVKYIDEAVKEKLIIQSAQDYIKELKAVVKENFSITPKEFENLVKAWMDENYPQELQQETEDFVAIYEILKKV